MLKKWLQRFWRGWADEDLAEVRRRSPMRSVSSMSSEPAFMSKYEWRAFVANDPSLQ